MLSDPRAADRPLGHRVGVVDRRETEPQQPPAGWAWSEAPVVLRVVAAAAVLQAVGLAAVAGWGITHLVAGTETNLGVGLFMVVFALGVAAVLVASARALLAGRRSGRAPIATWQLLQGATAFALGSATGLAGAWAVLALSGVVFVLLLTRPAVAHAVGAGTHR